jgi:hypothetical protein
MTGGSDRIASFLKGMFILADGRTKRISSWDRSGGNQDCISIGPSERAILAQVDGAGCVNKTYLIVYSVDRLWPRKLVLRMYWDGEEQPSVEVPVGDFYGVSNCVHRFFNSLLLAVNPPAYKIGPVAYNSYFPMPFAASMRIEVANEGEYPVSDLWYHIDYEQLDAIGNDIGRFHAQWRRENLTRAVLQPPGRWMGKNIGGLENYVILEAEGRGNYIGCVLGVDNIAGGWWGEGDDMIFIDGEEWPPSLHGTGTEEIFGGSACPDREYTGLYAGFHLISNADWSGKNAMYRFFINDPVRFQKSIRVTIEHGHNNNLANDYSSVAYWYQTEPHAPFPEFPAVNERIPILPEVYWRIEPTVREALSLMSRVISQAVDIDERQLYDYFEDECRLRAGIYKAFDDQDYQLAGNFADQLVAKLKERVSREG